MMRSLNAGLLAIALSMAAPLYADSQKPSTPNGVTASGASSSSIRVSWNASSDDTGVAGYNIYRNSSYYATVFDNTSYIDNAVSGGTTYSYGIVAFDSARNYTPISRSASGKAGSGSGSGSGNSSPPPASQANGNPVPPTGIRAEVQGSNQVKISWSAAPGNIAGYNVYRNGGYKATVRSRDYTDSSVSGGQAYRYQLVSFTNDSRFSIMSSELAVNTSSGGPSDDDSSGGGGQQQVTAPVESSSPSGGGGTPSGYHLVFSDEFRGSSLDRGKWNSRYRWGPDWIINGEKQYYVDRINNPDFGHSPFSFDGEHLTISATRTPDHLKSGAKWQPYLSGALTSFNKFKMRYGYVEMRAKLPRGRGMWPAFWMLHQNNNEKRPEIDVVEALGDRTNVVYHTYHYYDGWNLRSTPTYEAWGGDYSQGFHTYAVKWEPGRIVWYVDGTERNRYENGNVSWEDMYLLVNLAVGGWRGEPDGSTPLPGRLVVDYIRAYQK
jgi:beta-glucanase (GH16 family)